jgi:phage tail-like protein
MDINGTRFHLLLGQADWARCSVASGAVAWSSERAELTLEPTLFRFPPPVRSPHPVETRRGAARDQFGNWYWIAPAATQARVLSSGSRQVTELWPVAEAVGAPVEPPSGAFRAAEAAAPALAPEQLAGLAVTTDHYLVIGTLAPAGLLVFDLHAGGPPRHLVWPASVPFAPFDMAASDDGRAWILDRVHRRIWAIDRHLGVVVADQALVDLAGPDAFGPADPASAPPRPAPRFPTGIALDASSPVDAIDPVAIEALPDGSVVILDRGDAVRVVRYRDGQLVGAPVVLDVADLIDQPPAPGAPVLGADLAFARATAATGERLYVTAADGNQVFAFRVDRTDQALGLALVPDEYFPMRRFGGKALVSAGGQPWYDVDDRSWVPLIEQRRPRYLREAVIDGPVFDGHEAGCVWHRVFLDGWIPPQAAVDVWSRAADHAGDVARAAWQREPVLCRRGGGAELPFLAGAAPGAAAGPGTFELLFQGARGRYLQLRLGLRGDGRTTPRLRALRAWYPRFSYLEKYLPAAYRDDPDSASFLDRFLANLEGQFTAIEDKMAAAQVLLDPRTASAEALSWLAGWFGIALDPAWDEPRRRLFVRHAMDFFRMRGTLPGLRLALRLAFDDCVDERMFNEADAVSPASIRILERFRVRRTPAVVFGDPSDHRTIRAVPVAAAGPWDPSRGGDSLLRSWHAALAAGGLTDAGTGFPVTPPTGALGALWQGFVADALGFAPADGAVAERAWQQFLQRRYRRIAAARTAHAAAWASFDEVRLPDTLPPDGAPLLDWYAFQSLGLGLRRTAHRFTVLLPVVPSEAFAVDELTRRRDLARRLVEIEKPAHTLFDVKLYWAMFRIGEARLGSDTVLHIGSRAPELAPPLVLGQGFLAESYLAAPPPESVPERQIVGRDPLGQRCHIEETTP